MRRSTLLLGATLACLAPGALAVEAAPSVQDIGQLSIEELANLEVTSVSRRPEALSSAPAAIYVINIELLRRLDAQV